MAAFNADILLDLYACPSRPDKWRLVMDKLCADLGVRNAAFQIFRRHNRMLHQIWTVRDSFSEQHANEHDRIVNNDSNPRLNLDYTPQVASREIVRDSDRFESSCKEYRALQDRLRSIGFGESLTLGLRNDAGDPCCLILHREYGDGQGFGRSAYDYLSQLAPHLERAMNLSLEIEQNRNQKARLCGVLDALTFGLLICDENLSLDWANAEGRHLVNGSAHFVSRGQHVTLSDQLAHTKLKALCQPDMIEDADSTSQTIVLDRGGAEELQIRILPLSNHEEEWARCFLLILAQPDMPKSADPLHLAELFALTQAEGRVAAALLAGSTIKDYADERGIAEGSARNQLKQVLSKTGSGRQTDLIRKMFHSVLTPSLHYPKASRRHDLL